MSSNGFASTNSRHYAALPEDDTAWAFAMNAIADWADAGALGFARISDAYAPFASVLGPRMDEIESRWGLFFATAASASASASSSASESYSMTVAVPQSDESAWAARHAIATALPIAAADFAPWLAAVEREISEAQNAIDALDALPDEVELTCDDHAAYDYPSWNGSRAGTFGAASVGASLSSDARNHLPVGAADSPSWTGFSTSTADTVGVPSSSDDRNRNRTPVRLLPRSLARVECWAVKAELHRRLTTRLDSLLALVRARNAAFLRRGGVG
jgi:hypothetical protein